MSNGTSRAHGLYGELARWWPLISPPEEYADEAAFIGDVLASASGSVTDVLELGSGGGNNAVHLKKRFTMTLTDISADMLAVSRRMNPECEHREADMRTAQLGRTFDAVLVHDAVGYMVTESDLRRVVETAFNHCRPEGIAAFVPDHIVETFLPSTEHGGSDDERGRGARYLGWTWDPEPSDTWVQTDYAFLLHDDGSMQAAHETHRTGLFNRRTWLHLLSDAGFDATSLTERTNDDRVAREIFVGRPPSPA